MLTGQRISVDTSATKLTDLKIDADGNSAVLSWNCDADLNEDWFVEYTIDGMAKYTISDISDCRVQLLVLIPGARYKFEIGNGDTKFIGNVLVYTVTDGAKFEGFGINNEDFTFTMCHRPDMDEWNIYDLETTDITKEFKENNNEKTLMLAKEYDLPLTVGSDCHRPEDVGVSATLSEEKIESVEQYLDLVRSRKLIFAVGGIG
jgi:hypothetical protein